MVEILKLMLNGYSKTLKRNLIEICVRACDMNSTLGPLCFWQCLELPVVRAVLKSLHQVHMRKVPSVAGCIRLRSLLAVMCKSENKLVGTIDHKYLWSSRDKNARQLS